ncbi:MAG: tRNA pseudouridine synthase B [Candidatus Cryptobacteroides sp.]
METLLVADRSLKCLSDNIEDYPEGIVIPVDKPYRWTSADVIRKVKFAACRHFGKKNLKVGHAGTLDPLATGVLLVCIGKACRLAEFFQGRDKEYVAGVSFGATTPSYDLEKEVDRLFPVDGVSEDSLRGVLPSFVGEQEQVAPLFSAKSVDGVRAYELARREYRRCVAEGKEFAHDDAALLSRQRIVIHDIELLGFTPGKAGGAVADGAGVAGSAGCGSEAYGGAMAAGGLEGCAGDDGASRAGTVGLAGCAGAAAATGDAGTEGVAATGSQVAGVSTGCAGAAVAGNTESNGRDARIHVADTGALGLPHADIRISCSKGTYIRALARDLGEALGSGAHLDSLRRTRNGGFSVGDALSIDQAISIFRPGRRDTD